jgi:nucleoside-diphosphate-sugar epimerase
MKIFMTGGTGYIGRRVLAAAAAAGHEITALSRSSEGDDLVSSLGGTPLRGDLRNARSYRATAAAAEAVIHLGFDYRDPVETDRTAIEALLDATTGRDARLVHTSGMWVVGDTGGRTLGDDAPTDAPAELVKWRVTHERLVLEAPGEERGGDWSTAVVRPGHVYGRGGGWTARMFATAVKTGAAEYIGDGSNHWNNIHVDDLARLYLAVVESRGRGVFQAVDGIPETVGAIAAAACRAAGGDGSVRSVPLDTARERLGLLADALCLDIRLIAPAARALGWIPQYASFTSAAETAFAEWSSTRGT